MATDPVNRLPSAIPLPIPKQILKEIVEKAKDWAVMHGAAMRSKTRPSPDSIEVAPFALVPTVFPKLEFEKAVKVQVIINELMHRVAHDREFLTESLKQTITVDEFTRNLFNIYETIHNEGVTQPISLALLRSDLMLETQCSSKEKMCHPTYACLPCYCCWKQVEINTIASGFGWLGPIAGEIHRYVLSELGYDDRLENLPENNALQGLAEGLIEAWRIYGADNAVILFVIEEVCHNVCDQRFHEFAIRELNPKVRVIRRTLTQVAKNIKLGPKKELLVDGYTIAVVYYRAGYDPDHYPTKKEWDARLTMERSLAIKCPSIQYHLAGTKKVQQSLAKPGVLEKFINESKKIEQVQEMFTGLYSLDLDEQGDRAIQMAMESPERFVLKPQREGGGNNTYGMAIREAICKMRDSKERCAWILMDRILPPLSTGYIIRPEQSCEPQLMDLVSELGIYGVIIGDQENIYLNEQVGHMLRTKASTANEGGVAAGAGSLDSPYLVDW